MTVSRPCYTTREAVADMLDIRLTARMHDRIDKAIEAATNDVDSGICSRTFTPWAGSKAFDWPGRDGGGRSWRLWLNQHDLIRLDSATASGVTLDVSTLVRYPAAGPPYTRLEASLASSTVFQQGVTSQQTVVLTGLWGFQDVQAAAGSLAAAIDATTTSVTMSDAVSVGVGDLIQVGAERMLVVGRRSVDTGQTLGADLALGAAATTATVGNGALFTPGEIVTVDGERLRIEDITGNLLVVRRQFDGSTLAAHTSGTHIYAGRLLQVVRAAQGTVAATHAQGDQVTRHVPPALVTDYTAASASVRILQGQAGWARTVGTGDSQRQASGAGLKQLRDQLEGSDLARGPKAR